MQEGLLQLGAETGCGAGTQGRRGAPGPGGQKQYLRKNPQRSQRTPQRSAGCLAGAVARGGRGLQTRKESRLRVQRQLASLRTLGLWPDSQHLPLLSNPAAPNVGAAAEPRPGLQPPDERASAAGTPSERPRRARPAPPARARLPAPAAGMDVISRTSCAHTRAHTRSRPRRRPHTARAWTLSFCARFAGRASLPPASAFRPFLSPAAPRRFPPAPNTPPRAWLLPAPRRPLPRAGPLARSAPGEGRPQSRPARPATAGVGGQLGPQGWPRACALFVFPSPPEC